MFSVSMIFVLKVVGVHIKCLKLSEAITARREPGVSGPLGMNRLKEYVSELKTLVKVSNLYL